MTGEKQKRPFDRLSVWDQWRIEAALWGLSVASDRTDLTNIEQTRELAKDIYASILLGEFFVATLNLSDFESRATENVIKKIRLTDEELGTVDFDGYIVSKAAAAASNGKQTFPIRFLGFSTDIFADGVVGTASFIIEGTGTIIDDRTTSVDITINHAVGFEVVNDLNVTIGDLGNFTPIDLTPVPGMSEPVAKIEGSIKRNFNIRADNDVTIESVSPDAVAELDDAIQFQIDHLIDAERISIERVIEEGGNTLARVPPLSSPPRRKPGSSSSSDPGALREGFQGLLDDDDEADRRRGDTGVPGGGRDGVFQTGQAAPDAATDAPVDITSAVARPEAQSEVLPEGLPLALSERFDNSGSRFEAALRLGADGNLEAPAEGDALIELISKHAVPLTKPDMSGVFFALPLFDANGVFVEFETIRNAKGDQMEVDFLEATNRRPEGRFSAAARAVAEGASSQKPATQAQTADLTEAMEPTLPAGPAQPDVPGRAQSDGPRRTALVEARPTRRSGGANARSGPPRSSGEATDRPS